MTKQNSEWQLKPYSLVNRKKKHLPYQITNIKNTPLPALMQDCKTPHNCSPGQVWSLFLPDDVATGDPNRSHCYRAKKHDRQSI